jgi:peptidoglycan-N-acetylglucosamine deacetylase
MLKHFNIVVAFLVLLFGLLYLDQSHDLHWGWYLLLVLAFLGLEFYGAAFIQSNFHTKAICRVNTNEKVIALSFDDGPSDITLKMLQVLREKNVKATFFCIGNQIKGKEDILKKTLEDGHIIGNHSYSHGFLFDLKNTAGMVNDLELANTEFKRVIDKVPVFFRPPYGVTTPALARAVTKLKYQVIGWNIRSLDTKLKDPSLVLKRIKQRLVPGSIILLHDTMEGTEQVLRDLLMYLKEQNYQVRPLDELIKKQAYA